MEKQMVFSSVTAEVRFYIMQYVVQEEREYERKELVDLVYQKMGDNESVTAGVIAGAIKMLVGSGELVTVKRGVFKKGIKRMKSSALEKIHSTCIRFATEFEKACTINVLSLTEEERALYPEFVETLELGRANIYEFMDQLGDLVNRMKAAGVDKSLMLANGTSSVSDSAENTDNEACSDLAVSPEMEQPEPVSDAVVEPAVTRDTENHTDGLDGGAEENGAVNAKKNNKRK